MGEALSSKSSEWKLISSKNEDMLSQDIKDDILLAVGQAELLISKKGKFKQFSGLIDQCEANDGEQKTTCQDLQGFWEMIYAQVEKLNKNFECLSSLQANGWKKPEPKMFVPARKKLQPKIGQRPLANKPKIGSSSMRAFIEAQRAAKRNNDEKENSPAKMMKTPPQDPGSCNSNLGIELSTFDAGFFKVQTPIKTPGRGDSRLLSPLQNKTPAKADTHLLSSSVLREKMILTPKVHKDYSSCMRITRSMKLKQASLCETKRLEFS